MINSYDRQVSTSFCADLFHGMKHKLSLITDDRRQQMTSICVSVTIYDGKVRHTLWI